MPQQTVWGWLDGWMVGWLAKYPIWMGQKPMKNTNFPSQRICKCAGLKRSFENESLETCKKRQLAKAVVQKHLEQNQHNFRVSSWSSQLEFAFVQVTLKRPHPKRLWPHPHGHFPQHGRRLSHRGHPWYQDRLWPPARPWQCRSYWQDVRLFHQCCGLANNVLSMVFVGNIFLGSFRVKIWKSEEIEHELKMIKVMRFANLILTKTKHISFATPSCSSHQAQLLMIAILSPPAGQRSLSPRILLSKLYCLSQILETLSNGLPFTHFQKILGCLNFPHLCASVKPRSEAICKAVCPSRIKFSCARAEMRHWRTWVEVKFGTTNPGVDVKIKLLKKVHLKMQKYDTLVAPWW